MHDEAWATVEEITGRRVVACLSDQNFDPDISVEVFMLDRQIESGSSEHSYD